VPSEGKSLMLVLLAKTLSELGQRVLLVDMDLRLPQLHNRLGLDNLEGVSTLLTDETRSWSDVVRDVPNYPNWQVITAGHPVPDPPRLLSSARVKTLTRELAGAGYDIVLYDTPPALGLADAALLAEHLDGLLLLVSLNKVRRELPAEAIKRIEQAGAPMLGIVTNSGVPGASAGEAYGYGSPYAYAAPIDAALDPATTIGYYHSGGASEPEQRPGGVAALLPSGANRKRWGQSLKRWMGD
jgi:capsular exopolysaccharide synthesis family protein